MSEPPAGVTWARQSVCIQGAHRSLEIKHRGGIFLPEDRKFPEQFRKAKIINAPCTPWLPPRCLLISPRLHHQCVSLSDLTLHFPSILFSHQTFCLKGLHARRTETFSPEKHCYTILTRRMHHVPELVGKNSQLSIFFKMGLHNLPLLSS